MTTPINILDVDVNKLTLKPAKQDDKSLFKGRMFSIFHGDSRLETVLPELNVPFGCNKLENFALPGQLPKVTTTLSFDGINEETSRGKRLQEVHQKLLAIQNKIIDLISVNSVTFFSKDKKPVGRDEVIKRFGPMLWTPEIKEGGVQYPDTFRVNFQFYNPTKKELAEKTPDELAELRKNFSSKPGYPLFMDKLKNDIEVNFDNIEEVLYKRARVKIIVSFAFVWVMNSTQKASVNVSWLHGRIVSDPPKPDLNLLEDDSDGEIEVTPALKKVKVEEDSDSGSSEGGDEDDSE